MALLQSSAALGLLVLVAVAGCTPSDYRGYQVLRITPRNDREFKELNALLRNPELDVWRESRVPGDGADVMISPQNAPLFKSLLQEQGFNTSVMINDVQTLMQDGSHGRSPNSQDSSRFSWTKYHTLESIHEWLREKAKLYNNIATVISAGKGSEGRELLGLRIAHKPDLPIVFIESGVHAREWVSVPTAMWFIRKALEGESEIIKSYEWHVFPSVNPDGYAFTQKNRFWRKNRRCMDLSYTCCGADVNRNWPFKWQPSDNGETPNPCGDVFSGVSAGSEMETQGLIAYLKPIAKRTRVYISLHSYSQLLMYPWGYTDAPTKDADNFRKVAKKAADKLKSVYGTPYESGPISTTIYPAMGSSIDYAYSINISYPFVFELRDKGHYGFLLPTNQIIPTAEETLAGLSVILDEALKK